MPSGHLGIYEREGKSRTPIVEKFGPEVGGIMQTKEIRAGVKKAMLEKFKKNFMHNLAFYMGRASRS
jgi:hypothetical protein